LKYFEPSAMARGAVALWTLGLSPKNFGGAPECDAEKH
jgi:hypothetical protein